MPILHPSQASLAEADRWVDKRREIEPHFHPASDGTCEGGTFRITATGYSCRCQASLIDGANLLHPIQVLLARIKVDASATGTTDKHRSASVLAEHHEEY